MALFWKMDLNFAISNFQKIFLNYFFQGNVVQLEFSPEFFFSKKIIMYKKRYRQKTFQNCRLFKPLTIVPRAYSFKRKFQHFLPWLPSWLRMGSRSLESGFDSLMFLLLQVSLFKSALCGNRTQNPLLNRLLRYPLS